MNDLARFFFDLPTIEKRLLSTYNTSTYPPFNILKTSENNWQIELAVPGYTEEELNIKVQDGYLEVEGNPREPPNNTVYTHKGLTSKGFHKTFKLEEHMEVIDAKLENGILGIMLKKEIPKEKQPLLIRINS